MGFEGGSGQATLRGGTEQGVIAVGCAAFVLLGIAMVFSGTTSAAVLGGAIAVLFTVGCVRCLRAEVRVDDQGVLIRGIYRNHVLEWAEVAEARVVATNRNRLFAILEVTDRRGRAIKVDGIGFWVPGHTMDALPVGRMAAEINRRASGRSAQGS